MMNGSGLELQAVARADDTRAGAKYARWLDARPRITSTRSVRYRLGFDGWASADVFSENSAFPPSSASRFFRFAN